MKKISAVSFLAALCIALSACSADNGNLSSSVSSGSSGTSENAGQSTESSSSASQSSASSGSDVSGDISESVSESTSDNTADSSGETVSGTKTTLISVAMDSSEMFTTRDYEVGYSDCTEITFSDSGVSVSGSGASADGSTVTITKKGSYLIKGSTADGQIIVDADDDKIQIVLDGASVTSAGSAALYIKSADKVFVTTASGSVNKLASTGEYVQSDDNKVDGAVFAKSDITFNGTGSLEVTSETAHGIVCKDDIKITGGTYTITAAKKGIDCNESVRAAAGDITIISGTDGIHAENSDDAEKAFVYIGGGSITVTSGNDAIDASGEIAAADGTVKLISGGGSANAPAHTDNDFGMGRFGSSDYDSTSTESAKGIKSASLITISGGTFDIDSSDDAIHSDGTVNITDGVFKIASGDDGIHANDYTAVSGGDITISQSYEGIEGEVIDISGGNIVIRASDDGMNAAGGQTSSDQTNGGFGRGGMMDTDANAKLTISGGNITVNADGDGLDSNGYMYVTGGSIYVSGPTNSGNGALDFGISGTITGGYLVAAGASGMAENFGTDSTQGSILYTFDQTLSAGSEISLKDSEGNVLVSYSPEKSYQCAVISAPGVASGSTYTVSAGGSDYTVEMTSNIYGSGSGMGGFGGGMGNFGGNMGDFGGNMGDFGGNMGDFGGGRGGRGGFGGGRGNFDGGQTPPGMGQNGGQQPDGTQS